MRTEPCQLNQHYVRVYNELFERLNRELREIKTSNMEQLDTILAKKIHYAYRIILEELKNILSALIAIKKCGGYYVELFRVYTGEDIESYKSIIKRRMKQAKLIYRHVVKNLSSRDRTRREKIHGFREGLGRLLSIYKRSNRRIVILRDYLREVAKMPDRSYVVSVDLFRIDYLLSKYSSIEVT